jgi:C-terminal processing protease CtpA/Prc
LSSLGPGCQGQGCKLGPRHGRWLASALLATALAAAQTPTEASPEARRYLEAALDAIEQKSRVYSGDWPTVRAKALASIAAAAAKTPADTYPAIREALATIGDKQGLLIEPSPTKRPAAPKGQGTGMLVLAPDAIVVQVVPGSPAATAGLAVGDRIVAVDGVPEFAKLKHGVLARLFRSGQRQGGSIAPLALRVRTGDAEPRDVQVTLGAVDENVPPSGRKLDGGIAYLELLGVTAGPHAAPYDDTVHELLGKLDDGTLRGCIVDLRRNTGGTLWPMLAAIGPLAGSGKLGAFVSAHSSADWSYDAETGVAKSGDYELAKVEAPHRLRADLPVAVLTGPLTTQFGEALAIAFAGRAKTRRFGEGTRGIPIGNTSLPLADGALLVVTVTVDADRTGTRYDDVIAPDEVVATDWSRFGTADDPVIAAASRWLASVGDGK